MAMVWTSSESFMEQKFDLPKQPWWRRLFRVPRPAGTLYVTFYAKAEDSPWAQIEATVDYPENVENVVLRYQLSVNGEVKCMSGAPYVADMPKQD